LLAEAQDRLAEAVRRGIRQYVILGAGFDMCALRQPGWAQELTILEVDHPGTQALKRSYLAAAGLVMPENAGFASINLGHEALGAGRRRYQVSTEKPPFFSWLGVMMYLTEAAIDATLQAVAAFPAGSEIVLTFALPSDDAPSHFAQCAASLGEPWMSAFTPEVLEANLRDLGFARVGFLTPAEAEARYFRQHPDDLPVPKRTNILYAVL
jgi:methyltransferase (TIGR00027 family)